MFLILESCPLYTDVHGQSHYFMFYSTSGKVCARFVKYIYAWLAHSPLKITILCKYMDSIKHCHRCSLLCNKIHSLQVLW